MDSTFAGQQKESDLMNEVKQRRCCGLDVHKDTIFACVLSPQGGKPVQKLFGTFRKDLIRMRVWLKQMSVTEIAMESTGVYWRPVWNVLEEHGFVLVLANPQQVKALHGRKSDKRDSRRIAEFLQDRRLDASFVPSKQIRELRLLTRLRVSLLEQRNEVHNQIRDLLETVNIKLSSVASDILGVTGMNILKANRGGDGFARAAELEGEREFEKERGADQGSATRRLHADVSHSAWPSPAAIRVLDHASGDLAAGDREAGRTDA